MSLKHVEKNVLSGGVRNPPEHSLSVDRTEENT
jgi:hypothetical protein